MPRTKISKEEGGGYRVTIKPNNATEHPMVTRKFPSAQAAKEGIAELRAEWVVKRDARRNQRAMPTVH